VDEDLHAARLRVIRLIGSRRYVQVRESLFGVGGLETILDGRDGKRLRAGLHLKQAGMENAVEVVFKRHDAAGDAEDHDEQAGDQGTAQMEIEDDLAHAETLT